LNCAYNAHPGVSNSLRRGLSTVSVGLRIFPPKSGNISLCGWPPEKGNWTRILEFFYNFHYLRSSYCEYLPY